MRQVWYPREPLSERARCGISAFPDGGGGGGSFQTCPDHGPIWPVTHAAFDMGSREGPRACEASPIRAVGYLNFGMAVK